jgi:hypothetical protein
MLLPQVEMWEAVTRAVASLAPEGGEAGGTGAAQAAQMDPEQLVQYEGMLVAASAAQRRRCQIWLALPLKATSSPLPAGVNARVAL